MRRPHGHHVPVSLDRTTLWRAGLVQLVAVAVLSLALGLALPHSFFADWGWLAGPSAWMVCALVTARVLGLPPGRTLLGAVLAGLPSLFAVLVDAHWLGALLAVGLFAVWCAAAPGRGVRPARTA